MIDPLAGYYDESLPPELWEPAPAAPPVMGAAARRSEPEQTELEVEVGTTGEHRAPDEGAELGVVVTSDGTEHVGILPASAAAPPEQDEGDRTTPARSRKRNGGRR